MGLYGLTDTVLRRRTGWQHDPDKVALVFEDERVTYGQLADRVLRLAAGFAARGFRAGDTVAVLLANRPAYIETVYAVAHLGGVVVPVNYLLRPAEIAYIVADSRAGWVVTEERLRAGLADVTGRAGDDGARAVRRVVVDGAHEGELAYDTLLDHEPTEAPPPTAASEQRLLLQYTSGTTGFPKGVVHTHGTVLFNALAQIVDFDVTSDDVHMVVPSLSWAAGLHCLTLSTLWRGGTVVLKRTGGFTAEDFCALVERDGVTTAMLAPSVVRIILASDAPERHDLSSLRLVLAGGEPVTAAEIEQIQRRIPLVRFMQGYGVSEFPSTMVYLDSDQVVRHDGAAGRSSLAANVRVVDRSGDDTKPGEHGEIAVRSPQTSGVYHAKEGAEASAVVDGWLRTGDRGFVDDDGHVHVAGRVKEMIISGGLNVYPAEVERVLQGHVHVREAAVVPVPDTRYGQVGRAVVVVDDVRRVTPDELEALCRRELAGFKVPRHWVLRTAPLPRTVTGKIRRFELR
ncbi:AMP-binding protein [Streptomyces hirsutus]|uniref:AMP-binding protein n=1 Tax=Streptomyces hirsutus TaxID=35620 RepID=UPI0036A57AFD